MIVRRNDLGFRSPWLEQLDATGAPSPLTHDAETDVAIVGAGIAGLATAFFILRDTRERVLLLEGGRAGHGASGRNAGQLVTYFERPLCDLVDEFGFDLATRGQAEVEAAWGLLDLILAETQMPVTVERFAGAMGMFTLNHLLVHLRNIAIRRQAGLDEEIVEISDAAPFRDRIPPRYATLYTIVPQSRIRERLEVENDDYFAVLVNRKGCGNSALICQELLAYLKRSYPDRLAYADNTTVTTVALDATGASLTAGAHGISARRVVLCTNGFGHHTIENRRAGSHTVASRVAPRIGYMAAFLTRPGLSVSATSFIKNEQIGGRKPYYYSTRRPYAEDGQDRTLVCLGGPEAVLENGRAYEAEGLMPRDILDDLDAQVRPLVAPDRASGLPYDYTWHGLMAYTPDKVRLVGFEPENQALLYNLGCNGVGFLPSISGGRRIARLIGGEVLPPSIFDPRPAPAAPRMR